MTVGRVVGGLAASAAVAGGAVVALHMNKASAPRTEPAAAFSMPVAPSAHVTFAPLPTRTARPTTSTPTTAARTTVAPAATSATIRPVAVHSSASSSVRPTPTVRPTPAAHPSTAARPAPARTSAAPHVAAAARGTALPLHYSTGSATRVITVTAPSRGRTTARLQAWTKASGGGWRKYGTAVTAHIGAQGMSTHPSESKSATPMGSFTLTQAFGYYGDPGTSLPYLRTRPSDWWISQAGPLYNTHQRCASNCRFNRGSPNEHLYYERPYYGYAVVIDYNTRNAPGGVRQGAGSAFFLHVTDGAPTAGCIAISQSKLVTLLRWLKPSAHPRILIGTT